MDNDGRSNDESVPTNYQAGSQSKFLYFEVATVYYDSKTVSGSHFESLRGATEACWWSENALALIKKDGTFCYSFCTRLTHNFKVSLWFFI